MSWFTTCSIWKEFGAKHGQNRLEAFSDGVIAILITIMVLELKPPNGADFRALLPLWPIFMSYVLSFVYVGIYWNKLQYASYPYRLCTKLISLSIKHVQLNCREKNDAFAAQLYSYRVVEGFGIGCPT